MQLSAFIEFNGLKLVFDSIELPKAQLLITLLKDRDTLIFVDNFSDSIDAFAFLSKYRQIKLVGFDRDHNFSSVSHKIEKENFEFIDVSILSDNDVQTIYDALPSSLRISNSHRHRHSKDDSLFEFINKNVQFPNIKLRFKEVLTQLVQNDDYLAEFLVFCCYVHYARTPVSFDMLWSYFSDDPEIEGYDEIYKMRDELGGMIKDYAGDLMLDENQDYFTPRSVYLAEAILDQVDPNLLKEVLKNALYNIPTYKICSYNVFRRRAYDKSIVGKAFHNWEEGKAFYEYAFDNDFKNPYILQQGALYLAQKKKYTEAFHWIDRANNIADNKIFSIRNSHAYILFDANISLPNKDENARRELDKSMDILERCYGDDNRKTFHVIRYANQALQYNEKYGDEKSQEYLINAINWLKGETKREPWNRELFKLSNRIDARILRKI
jgi:hypothetical protein